VENFNRASIIGIKRLAALFHPKFRNRDFF
jgi:hypothetical protein